MLKGWPPLMRAGATPLLYAQFLSTVRSKPLRAPSSGQQQRRCGGSSCTHMRIGYAHADRLLSYPHLHNLSASSFPIHVRVLRSERTAGPEDFPRGPHSYLLDACRIRCGVRSGRWLASLLGRGAVAKGRQRAVDLHWDTLECAAGVLGVASEPAPRVGAGTDDPGLVGGEDGALAFG